MPLVIPSDDSISAAVSPDAPAYAIPKAEIMLKGEKKKLPADFDIMIFPALNAKLLTAYDASDPKADDANKLITVRINTAFKILAAIFIFLPVKILRPHELRKTAIIIVCPCEYVMRYITPFRFVDDEIISA